MLYKPTYKRQASRIDVVTRAKHTLAMERIPETASDAPQMSEHGGALERISLCGYTPQAS